ncbi:Metallo-dependent phosphatase-like protein [Blastocladiella britannica]|nr:Metallo-dependent phosphatase-like protein [Blastocladiella britannica]
MKKCSLSIHVFQPKMHKLLIPLVLVVGFWSAASSSLVVNEEQQQQFTLGRAALYRRAPRTESTATGKFWHFTDPHIDPHYTPGTFPDTSCHFPSYNTSGTQSPAGPLGAPMTMCDSPPLLIDATIAYAQSLGPVDFVVVTGDSARHDTNLPKSWDENFALVDRIAGAVSSAWPEIPILHSIGNNDVYPHNSLAPTSPTLARLAVSWSSAIPDSQRATFIQGGYYAVPLGPNLMGLSLNTLFFYAPNDQATDCAADPNGPGGAHLAWIADQLATARAAGHAVVIAGHVPPHPNAWLPGCIDRYAAILGEFGDVVMAQPFGHVNLDHFNARHLLSRAEYATSSQSQITGDLEAAVRALDKTTSTSVVLVSPSMLPNYYPSIRQFEYHGSRLLDYTQYFLNLTSWQQQHQDERRAVEFQVEYRATEAYGLHDLSPTEYARLAVLLVGWDMRAHPQAVRAQFWRYLSVSTGIQ